nr:reverse transcriptase domain-containing protein [Tanacetum cinerariifolium]
RDCRSPTNANVTNNQRGNGAGQKVTCYEYGEQDISKEMGSFDVIIGMDWLSRYQAVIMYTDKIVRIPWGRETLIFHGNGSNQEHEARLNIISCAKTQKYMLNGCQIFLAHVTTKEAEGKSKKKRPENVPIVLDFPKVFPEDLSGLPLTRQV